MPQKIYNAKFIMRLVGSREGDDGTGFSLPSEKRKCGEINDAC